MSNPAERASAGSVARARAGLAVVALFLAPVAMARAQSANVVAPGQRVRVTAQSMGIERRIGQVVGQHGDTLHLRFHDRADTVAIPVAGITALDVSRGTRRRWIRGGMIGLAAGAALGVMLGAVAGGDSECEGQTITYGCGDERGWAMFGLGVVGAGVGTVIGVTAGARRPVDRWERVPVQAPTSPGRGASAMRGAALSVSVRF